ncbi:MAG TPA: phosphotransferase [Candidatus Limnocylindrales bacterium]|nr:phosphotransferase [Candidatus Limnocylindrales bacterium]
MTPTTTLDSSTRRARDAIGLPIEWVRGRIDAWRAGPTIERVLADIEAVSGGALPTRGWVVRAAHSAAGSGVVALVGPDAGGAPRLMVRAGVDHLAFATIRRERESLEAIGRLELDPVVRRLIPRVVASGVVDGLGYIAESVVPGRRPEVRALDARQRGALVAAVAAVARGLHEAGEDHRTARPLDVERWVDRRVDVVRHLLSGRSRNQASRRAAREATLDRIESTLAASLRDCPVRVARIHGDLWPGNVLVADSPAPASGPDVTGIVDWDSSQPDELPFQDLLHVEMYTRKLLERKPLGAVIAAVVRDRAGPRGVPAAGDAPDAGDAPVADAPSLTPREEVLLYWLRQVEMNSLRSPATARTERWLRGNVDAVLAAV